MGKRIAMNAPIQGTASDIMKIAMIKLNKEIQKIKSTDLLLQIHDEIIIQTPKESANKVSKIVNKEMEGASKLKVPLFVDIKENISVILFHYKGFFMAYRNPNFNVIIKINQSR